MTKARIAPLRWSQAAPSSRAAFDNPHYPNLHERIHAYMRELKINFACFDFIVPLEGEPIFLEANCNGQWLWVENLTGLPIGEAIADEFLTAIKTEGIKAGG